MFSGKLLYHQEQHHFELNGIVLCPGNWIEIYMMGHWIAGQLNKDFTGWYFSTSDQVGIRLRAGLIARFAQVPSLLLTKEEPHRAEPPKGEELKLILVVEDDEVHASMLDQIFRQETPYHVYCASDGQTAWEFLHEIKPNLIVLDYMLPRMSGLMLYDRIHAEEALQDIPVVMISASLPKREVEQRGIIGLQKPFEIDELLQTTRDLIDST
jgi:CheY-like chemotaxis protein